MKLKKTLVLLDRDGTLIKDGHYPKDPSKVRLLPGVTEGLRSLKKAGLAVVVVSNQSGVGRGILTRAEAESVNRRFLSLLRAKKAGVDGLYWCPHEPSADCSCRKPKLGLVKRASRDLHISWKRSISVGDRPSDVELGQRTGGLGVLVRTGYGEKWVKHSGADHVSKNLKDAVRWIIKRGIHDNNKSK